MGLSYPPGRWNGRVTQRATEKLQKYTEGMPGGEPFGESFGAVGMLVWAVPEAGDLSRPFSPALIGSPGSPPGRALHIAHNLRASASEIDAISARYGIVWFFAAERTTETCCKVSHIGA